MGEREVRLRRCRISLVRTIGPSSFPVVREQRSEQREKERKGCVDRTRNERRVDRREREREERVGRGSLKPSERRQW